jgi:hypothetical protein
MANAITIFRLCSVVCAVRRQLLAIRVRRGPRLFGNECWRVYSIGYPRYCVLLQLISFALRNKKKAVQCLPSTVWSLEGPVTGQELQRQAGQVCEHGHAKAD